MAIVNVKRVESFRLIMQVTAAVLKTDFSRRNIWRPFAIAAAPTHEIVTNQATVAPEMLFLFKARGVDDDGGDCYRADNAESWDALKITYEIVFFGDALEFRLIPLSLFFIKRDPRIESGEYELVSEIFELLRISLPQERKRADR